MAKRTAILSIRVVSDAKDARKGMDDTASSVEKFERGLDKASRKAGIALTAIGAGAFGAALKAEELASANDRLGAVLANQGMEHATDRQLAYAESLERSLGIDEKTIKAAQAKLGTFSAVASSADEVGGAFDRATMASIDLAAAGFGSIEDNSVQLGKALQDPIKGLGSLAKAGVSFTEAERDMIAAMVEANDVAGAQDIILQAIEGQVGGVAEATADSSAIMALAWGNVVEQLGMALLPALDQLAAVMPVITDFIIDNSDVVLLAIGVVAAFAAGIIALNAAFKAYRAIVAAVTIATKAYTIAQKALNLAMRANPIGIIITLIGLLVGAILWLWNEHEGFRRFVTLAWEGFKLAIGVVADWLKVKLSPAIDFVKLNIEVFRAVAEKVWNKVLAGARKVGEYMGKMAAAIAKVKSPIDLIYAAFRPILNIVTSIISALGRISFPQPPAWMRSLTSGFSLFSAEPGDGMATMSTFDVADFNTTQQLQAPAPYAAGRGLTGAMTGDTINITVNGALDSVAVARQIEQVIGKVMRRDGRRTQGQVTFA